MFKIPKRFMLIVSLLIIAAQLLVACGGDTPTATPIAAPTNTTAPVAAPTDTTAPVAQATDTAAPAEATATTAPTGGKVKVGLSFSDFATERWKNEEQAMRKLLEGLGYEVLTQEANHDVKLQNDQIDNMVSQGAKVLIIVAEDGDAAVTSVDKAAAAGVKVISYDRLIKSPNVSAYISFDNIEVGRQQAMGVKGPRYR